MRKFLLTALSAAVPALLLCACSDSSSKSTGNAKSEVAPPAVKTETTKTEEKSGPQSTPPSGWSTQSGKAFAARMQDAKGIDNMGRYTQGLCRGAQPEKQGFQYLKDQGFKTIISLRTWSDEDEEEARKYSLKAVAIPLRADLRGSKPPTEEQIKLFFDTILDPANQPVYFHCAHGKDRTGTMAALYRMEIDGWTAEEAIEEMQAFGFNDIWKDLYAFVRAYKPKGYGKAQTR